MKFSSKYGATSTIYLLKSLTFVNISIMKDDIFFNITTYRPFNKNNTKSHPGLECFTCMRHPSFPPSPCP